MLHGRPYNCLIILSGIGYIRLLINFVGSAYSVVYLSLSIAYFLYTATHNLPFMVCVELVEIEVSM